MTSELGIQLLQVSYKDLSYSLDTPKKKVHHSSVPQLHRFIICDT